MNTELGTGRLAGEGRPPPLHQHAPKCPSLPVPSGPRHFHPLPLTADAWCETKRKSISKQTACTWPGMRQGQRGTAEQESAHRPVEKTTSPTARVAQEKVVISGERNTRRLRLGCGTSLMRTESVHFEGRGKSAEHERSRAPQGKRTWLHRAAGCKAPARRSLLPLQPQPVRILSHLQQGRVKFVALVKGKSYEAQEGG